MHQLKLRALVCAALALSGAVFFGSLLGGQDPAPAPASGSSGSAPERLGTGVDLKKIKLPAPAKPAVPAAGGTTPAPAPVPAPAPAVAGPVGRIEWSSPTEFDLGTIMQGETRTHRFQGTAGGEHPLVITQVKPSCGCTIAKLETIGAEGVRSAYTMGQEIPVGTSFEIESHFNSTGKRGQLTTVINVFTNDPRGPQNLTLKSNVVPFLEANPPSVNLLRLSASESRESTLVVKSPVVPAFRLSLPDPLRPELHVTLTPVNPDAEGRAAEWTVKTVLGPNVPEGPFNQGLRLVSDVPVAGAAARPDGSPATHELVVYVMATVTGVIAAEPAYVSFGLLRPGQALARTVRITNYDTVPLSEPKVSLRGYTGEFEHKDRVALLVKPIEPGKSYDVEVSVLGLPETAVGQFQGYLVIETGNPAKPTLEVRLAGVCQAGATAPKPPAPVPQAPVPAPAGSSGGQN